MNEKALQEVVLRIVLTELAKAGESFVPVTSSNRHVHLSQRDVERLFGAGYQLTKLRDLQQPGQYACQETVVLESAKGKTSLRVVGPVRSQTQIELSFTDCYKLGIPPVLRMSEELSGTPGGTLVYGDRRVALDSGIIVAKRHLHMSVEEAAAYGLRDGDKIALHTEGDRAATLHDLIVRTGAGHSLEAHIDKDEANACGIRDGQLCRIGKAVGAPALTQPPSVAALQGSPLQPLHTYMPRSTAETAQAAPKAQPKPVAAYIMEDSTSAKTKILDLSRENACLIAEDDVLAADRNGYKIIRYGKGAVVTPLARDAASAKQIALTELT